MNMQDCRMVQTHLAHCTSEIRLEASSPENHAHDCGFQQCSREVLGQHAHTVPTTGA